MEGIRDAGHSEKENSAQPGHSVNTHTPCPRCLFPRIISPFRHMMGSHFPTHLNLDVAMGLALANDMRTERAEIVKSQCVAPTPCPFAIEASRAQRSITFPAWVLGKKDLEQGPQLTSREQGA